MKLREQHAVRTLDDYSGSTTAGKQPIIGDFGWITPSTPLSNINLNWRERELPERVRTKHVHRLHPYLGKYVPQLVEVLLDRFVPRGGRVLDPFAGSGTTLVPALEAGGDATGGGGGAVN